MNDYHKQGMACAIMQALANNDRHIDPTMYEDVLRGAIDEYWFDRRACVIEAADVETMLALHDIVVGSADDIRDILDRVVGSLDDIATNEDVVITAFEQQRKKRKYEGEDV